MSIRFEYGEYSTNNANRAKQLAGALALVAAIGVAGSMSAIASAAYKSKRYTPTADNTEFRDPVRLAFGCTGEGSLITGGGRPIYARVEGKIKCPAGVKETITVAFQAKQPGHTWQDISDPNETLFQGYNYVPRRSLTTSLTEGDHTKSLRELEGEGDDLRGIAEYTVTVGSRMSRRYFTNPVTAGEISPSIQHTTLNL